MLLNVIRLIRLPNLIILLLSLLLVQFFLVIPFLKIYELEKSIDHVSFWCVVFSALLMMAGGFIINDYHDLETDRVNKPEKVLIGKSITRQSALNLYLAFTIAGLTIGLYGGWRLGYYNMMSITPLPAILLWFYATTFKRKAFVGNFIVAFLCGGILLLPVLFNINTLLIPGLPAIVAGYALFAFLLTLIREIIKDLEDINGDLAAGCKTLPISMGIKFSKTLVISITAIVLLLIASFQWLQIQSDGSDGTGLIGFSYILLFIQIPLLISIYLMLQAVESSDYKRISNLTKYIMVTGLLSIILFWYLMN